MMEISPANIWLNSGFQKEGSSFFINPVSKTAFFNPSLTTFFDPPGDY
jgi:hypothetical protein